eukprot:TRINITY_DN3115_c0_g1_i2.p1 TRINITY_DN3115_c0_g1~~TRINITY_DN3115_c0_g1_i2.p1  ORF type:complete len:238 (-),score=57.16 TRINITY_DN3115_c0_g1_i2:176-847(-)
MSESRAKVVGILGGSFDPVHSGHIYFALSCIEAKVVDEVVFIPAFVNPFKVGKRPPVSADHRLNMLKLALQGHDNLSYSDLELRKASPSYTIDTIRALYAHAEANNILVRYRLIIGEDNLASFPKWREAEAIAQLAGPLIVCQRFAKSAAPILPPTTPSWLSNFVYVAREGMSSTLVRETIESGKAFSHLVPAPVLDYIEQHQLYGCGKHQKRPVRDHLMSRL